MFDNYKKTLTKQEKKQFAAIQKQLVPLFNDFDNLDTVNQWMNQKINNHPLKWAVCLTPL